MCSNRATTARAVAPISALLTLAPLGLAAFIYSSAYFPAYPYEYPFNRSFPPTALRLAIRHHKINKFLHKSTPRTQSQISITKRCICRSFHYPFSCHGSFRQSSLQVDLSRLSLSLSINISSLLAPTTLRVQQC
jgi:hypothetical protein